VGGAGTLADDVVLVLRTSGTTGAAKVVPLQNAMMCAAVQVVRDTLRLRPDDRCLNVMPLVHVHGFVAGLLAPLASGGSVVCAPGMDGRQFGGWLVDTAATWYTAVPTMHQTVAALLGTEPSLATRSRLRFIRSASAPLAPSIAATLEAAFKVPVLEAYGMTEAAHQIASNPLPPAARKPGSVGTPTGSRVSIMDASGRHLDPGQVGEVAVGGPRLFAGYERAAGLDRSAFVDGWFQTGDQGYLDDEGYLFLTGRSKEMINRGGETIAPRVVDEVLLEHPGVAQAVAFGLPDARLGEIVAAAVVAVAGTQVSPQELRRFAATRLAAAAVPEQIFLVANIPVGPTGKMQRVRLAGLLAPLLPPSSPDSPLRREPTTASECLVAGIWMELLNLPEIGLDDRFTDLGGDSALAMRVLARLKNLLGFRVSDSLVLTAPTVAELAAAVAPLVADGAGRGPDVTRSTT
jgi:acyl-CoA synthetase (AMP-forming)/AMP-acid ligase II/acyl carrier protein